MSCIPKGHFCFLCILVILLFIFSILLQIVIGNQQSCRAYEVDGPEVYNTGKDESDWNA